MDRETIVITWMDGKVATYEDIRHSTQGGWLYIYGGADGATMLWRFPHSNIRAVGGELWRPDDTVDYSPAMASTGKERHDAT